MAYSHRVTARQNDMVGGLALMADQSFNTHMSDVEKLRSQHRSYLAGLPTDPDEKLKQISRLIHHSGEDLPRGVALADHVLKAILAIVEADRNDCVDCETIRCLVTYATIELSYGIRDLLRCGDILAAGGDP